MPEVETCDARFVIQKPLWRTGYLIHGTSNRLLFLDRRLPLGNPRLALSS
jgi:hypothetical protein